jgi:hypothetical protein
MRFQRIAARFFRGLTTRKEALHCLPRLPYWRTVPTNMRKLCNQFISQSVTLRIQRVAWATAIFTATHAPASSTCMNTHMRECRVPRQKSRDRCIGMSSHVRNSFTRLAKISVCLYTSSTCATNCRDAQTRTHRIAIKPQLTSCIYVANLMQLRRCEWRYVACAPPRQPFQGKIPNQQPRRGSV